MQVFAVDGITIQQFNESAGAQTVPHLHVHVIPRITGVPLKPPNGKTEKAEVLADQAARLAAAIKPVAFKEIPLFSRDALLDYARQIERRP
jgi:histidine triad (HIT) family protein